MSASRTDAVSSDPVSSDLAPTDLTPSEAPHPDALPSSATALLRRALRRRRGAVLASAALVTVWQVCELLVPALIGVIIDRAVVTGDLVALACWSAVLALQFVVLSYSYRFGARIGFRALQAESHALRTEVSGHVLRERGARSDRLPGDVLSTATADAEGVASVIRQLTFAVAALVGIVVSAVVLAAIDLVLAVVVLVGVPAVLGLTQLFAPRLARRSAVRQEALGRASGIASDFVRGLRPLKGIGGEAAAEQRYREQSRRAAHASVGAARWEGLMHGGTVGLSGLFLAVVALVAGLRAADGEIGVGELVTVVGISQFLGEPLRMLTQLVALLAQSRASAQRVVDFLATPPLVHAGTTVLPVLPTGAGAGSEAVPTLALTEVDHGPLRGVCLTAQPGRLVAVVAEDPADAAALMALLHGEAVPEAGAVTLDGVPLTDLALASIRARLLVADHHVDLFDGTVRSNVDPRGVLDPDRLAQVLAASAADDVVAQASSGLEAAVSVGGTTYSGGQRQRLGLARALAADPPVLVLHDPTTAVDAVTEARIAAGLRAARHAPGAPPRTTLLLAGSPALLACADEVVHLRGGRVVGRGTHEELVRRPEYRTAVLR